MCYTDRLPGKGTSLVGIAMYILLNWSYTVAVFTSPGSTTESQGGYNSLPTHNPPVATSFTVKSTGELRFCKKCQARKPDRAHHCSTCRKCVLKMDHHCPWLATCVGLRNYKPFMLFLIYTTIFCFFCFAVSATWVWSEILSDGQYTETLMPVNYVMLSVISGIIGLVLAGFTGWHIMLASRGQTTIECLEKTRYLSPLRKSIQLQHIIENQGEGNGAPSYGQQLRDIHTNALPGVTRPEEGEIVIGSNELGKKVNQTYDDRERARARQKYEEYLDEQDSEKLPNAFDLGWRKNLLHIFGEKTLLWFFPICNTTGDGWSWEPSPKWLAARNRIRQDRERQREREQAAGWGGESSFNGRNTVPTPAHAGAGRHYLDPPATSMGSRSPSKADRILGRDPSQYADGQDARCQGGMPMQNLRRHHNDLEDDDDYNSSSDEQEAEQKKLNGRPAMGWPAQRLVSPASGLLGKAPSTSNGKWNSLDGNADDGVD
jgi:palmitoyltransferase ZDHHC2/15/20